MKKTLITVLALFAFVPVHADTIDPLPQFTSTTTPSSAITQRTFGKPLKITGLTTGLCLSLDSNSIVTTSACSGGGGGTSAGNSKWATSTPTTTITPNTTNEGILVTGSSTITQLTVTMGTTTSATSTNLYVDGQTVLAGTTGKVGIASTSPWALFSVNPNALGSGVPEFAIGSSTLTHLLVEGTGRLVTRISSTGANQEFQRWTTSDDSKFAAIQQDASDGFLTIGSQSSNTNFNLAAGGQRVITLYSTSGGVIRTGVGTTTPIGFFSVEQPTLAGTPYVVFVGDQGTSSPLFAIAPNGNSYFGGGNLGLSTTTPQALLSLVDGTTAAGGIKFGSDTNLYRAGTMQLKTDSTLNVNGILIDGSQIYPSATNLSATLLGGGSGGGQVKVYGTTHATKPGYVELLGNNVIALTVDNSQRIGIGTTTPQALLSIPDGTTQANGIKFGSGNWIYESSAGNMSVDSNLSNIAWRTRSGGGRNFTISIGDASTPTYKMISDGGSNNQITRIGTEYSGPLDFETNTTVRATILATGNFGISTSSPYTMLSVAGTTTASSFVATSTTEVSSFQRLTATNATSSSLALTGLATAAGTYLAVDANGVVIATTSPSAITSNASAYKAASNWATTAILAGTPTYANGSSGVGATLTEVGAGALSVDGNAPVAGDRVLVKNQASAFQNGIYTVTATGSGIASYILTRSTDFNNVNDIFPGVATYIIGGTVNVGDTYVLTTTGAIVVGTTDLTFAELGFGALSASNGITLTGNALSLDQTFGALWTPASTTYTGGVTIKNGTTTNATSTNLFSTTASLTNLFASTLGIATTSPGTKLSIGNGANYVNIDNTATSTFSQGINLNAGCFAISGVCVGGGSGGGGVNRFATTSVVAMSTTTANISLTENVLEFYFQASTSANTVPMHMYFNGESTGTNYACSEGNQGAAQTTCNQARQIDLGQNVSGAVGQIYFIHMTISNLAGAPKTGTYQISTVYPSSGKFNNIQNQNAYGVFSWDNRTSRITSISITTGNTQTFDVGAFMQVTGI